MKIVMKAAAAFSVACLAFGLMGIGAVLAIKHSSIAETDGLRVIADQKLSRLLRQWNDDHTPAEDRVVSVSFSDGTDTASVMHLPPEQERGRRFAALLKRLWGGKRQAAALCGETSIADWIVPTLTWQAERERTFKALAESLARARHANVRIAVVAKGHAVETALEFIALAGDYAPPGEPITVDRFVGLGMELKRLKAPEDMSFFSYFEEPDKLIDYEAGFFEKFDRPDNLNEWVNVWMDDSAQVLQVGWPETALFELFDAYRNGFRLRGNPYLFPSRLLDHGKVLYSDQDILEAIQEMLRDRRSLAQQMAARHADYLARHQGQGSFPDPLAQDLAQEAAARRQRLAWGQSGDAMERQERVRYRASDVLRKKTASRSDKSARAKKVAACAATARRLLAEKKYRAAAAELKQASALGGSPEVDALWAEIANLAPADKAGIERARIDGSGASDLPNAPIFREASAPYPSPAAAAPAAKAAAPAGMGSADSGRTAATSSVPQAAAPNADSGLSPQMAGSLQSMIQSVHAELNQAEDDLNSFQNSDFCAANPTSSQCSAIPAQKQMINAEGQMIDASLQQSGIPGQRR
jgi:hypothetical protein